MSKEKTKKARAPKKNPYRAARKQIVCPPKKQELSRSDIQKMNIDELHCVARSKGIPFGGLSRDRLIKKIIQYVFVAEN